MILTDALCRRFFKIYDPLILFADKHLGLNELEFAPDGLPTEDSQYEVSCELWSNAPQVIDAFVRQNPAHLSTRDLRVAISWKDALFADMAYEVQPDGTVEFMYEDLILRPKGLTREIGGMLNAERGMAKLAIIPLEGELTYAGQVGEVNISMGPGMRASYIQFFKETREKGGRVETAADFLALVPEAKKAALDRKTQRFIEDTEYDMNPPTSWPGFHRGVLADVPQDQRGALIMEENRRLFAEAAGVEVADYARARLTRDCRKGPATSDFATLAMLEKKDVLLDIAKRLGVKRTSGLNKAKLAEACVERLTEPEADLDAFLYNVVPSEFPLVRRLVEAGGRIEAPFEGLDSLDGFMMPIPLLVYWFDEGDRATCVMPDAVRDAFMAHDLEGMSAHYDALAKLEHVVDLLTETRGMLAVVEAAVEFARLYPGALESAELIRSIIAYAADEFSPCEAYREGEDGTLYLVDSPMLDQVQKSGVKMMMQGSICFGELGPLQNLLDKRVGKEPWPLPQELVEASSVVDWAESLPTGRTLLQFLNENIPDGKNDLLFADKVFEGVVVATCNGVQPAKIIEWVAEQGVGFSDMRHENKLVGYVMNLYNDLPRWDNNGWPPAALHSTLTGRPDFRNEDGSRKKVGRNDPCPCGSGKKYKKCCGR